MHEVIVMVDRWNILENDTSIMNSLIEYEIRECQEEEEDEDDEDENFESQQEEENVPPLEKCINMMEEVIRGLASKGIEIEAAVALKTFLRRERKKEDIEYLRRTSRQITLHDAWN